MSIINHKECPLCGSNNITELYKFRDKTVTDADFPIWQCSSCNFAFTQNVEDEDNCGKYYKSEEYISHSNTNKGLKNKLYHFARSIMLNRKFRFVERANNSKKGSVLDYGCGTGFFPAKMKQKGWQASGIEQDSDARKFANDNLKIDAFDKNHLNNIEESAFDVVTMWHVMEHIYNPDLFLKKINRIVKKGGKFIVAVPNFESYDAKLYREYWAAIDAPRHIWHFTTNTAKIMIEREGFKLEHTDFLPFDSFYISLLSEQLKTGKTNWFKGLSNGFKGYTRSRKDPKNSSSIVLTFSKI